MVTKITFSVLTAAFYSIILQSDYFSRMRWSDISDTHNRIEEHIGPYFYGAILIGIVILVAIYMWQEHKSVVKAIGKILLVCLVLYVIGCVANLVYEYNRRRPRVEKKTEQVTTVTSDAPASAFSVTPTPTPAPAFTTVSTKTSISSSADSWERYYPEQNIGSYEKKTNDFLVAIINNPTFSIYDFMRVGLTAGNTQFLAENQYAQSSFVRNHFEPATFHQTYIKMTKAWQAFLRCQGVNINDSEISKYMMHYDMFDINKPSISDAANPQLIWDLQTIPLQ